jgi:polyhydroxybutyrate depolymerase
MTARRGLGPAFAALCLALALLPGPGGRAAELAAPWSARTLGIDGTTREYFVREPTQPPRAIVLLLHGNGGSARALASTERPHALHAWHAIAEREALRLVIPEGAAGSEGRQGWNDCRADADNNPTTDDVRFLTRLAAAEQPRGRRVPVFVAGTSNGGQMALRLAIEQPRAVRGVAAVVAAMAASSECREPRRAVNVLFISGTADTVLPYGGGAVQVGRVPRGSALSAERSVEIWAALARTRPVGMEEQLPDLDPGDGSRVTRVTHSGSLARVAQLRVEGGGHAEPTLTGPRVPWPGQNRDIETAEEIWRFFAATLEPPSARPR